MHAVLDQHEEYVALQERIREMTDRQTAYRKHRGDVATEAMRRRSAWEQACQEAALTGGTPPPAPDVPEVPPDMSPHFRFELEQLRAEHDRLIVRIAPQIEQQAAEVERQLLARVRTTRVEGVGPLADEVAVLVDTIREVRRVADGQDRFNTKPGARTRPHVSPAEVLVAAYDGWSLLEPLPLPNDRSRQVIEPEPGGVQLMPFGGGLSAEMARASYSRGGKVGPARPIQVPAG
jgi:hypothetical protein